MHCQSVHPVFIVRDPRILNQLGHESASRRLVRIVIPETVLIRANPLQNA